MHKYLVFLLMALSHSQLTDHLKCEVNEKDDNRTFKYTSFANSIFAEIDKGSLKYKECSSIKNDPECECYDEVIEQDLLVFKSTGITKLMMETASKYGTRYKIFNKKLYREETCMFPARCIGVEHFLLKLLPQLPNVDFVVNTRDWPQVNSRWGAKVPVFSFSKTKDYDDIMYPAWTFWAGGPAISLYPTGIGRWDILRERLKNVANKIKWSQKLPIGFFRGSRTSNERDALILLSRKNPNLVDAQYTKNQAWKSPKDTLDAPPAQEVSFEDHCNYKYLFNFRGVAASFRLKHLFLCKSLVFHVGDDWKEFYYSKLTPFVHYVPIKSSPTSQELADFIKFFRENDELASKIALQGYDFISKHLRMNDIDCYWKKLLTQFEKLLKYKVEKESTLIEISIPREL